jgi:hypothetical protein
MQRSGLSLRFLSHKQKKSRCKVTVDSLVDMRVLRRQYSSQAKERHLLLMSGGVESTTLLYDIVKKGILNCNLSVFSFFERLLPITFRPICLEM